MCAVPSRPPFVHQAAPSQAASQHREHRGHSQQPLTPTQPADVSSPVSPNQTQAAAFGPAPSRQSSSCSDLIAADCRRFASAAPPACSSGPGPTSTCFHSACSSGRRHRNEGQRGYTPRRQSLLRCCCCRRSLHRATSRRYALGNALGSLWARSTHYSTYSCAWTAAYHALSRVSTTSLEPSTSAHRPRGSRSPSCASSTYPTKPSRPACQRRQRHQNSCFSSPWDPRLTDLGGLGISCAW